MSLHLKGKTVFIIPFTSHQYTWLAGNNIVSGKSEDEKKTEPTDK